MAMRKMPNTDASKTASRTSRREQGLAERRERLVRAAGALIEKSDNGIFSMPELAAEAGLSLATPYNLFGSKAAVLSALFNSQVRNFHQDSDWMNDLSPADLVLGVIDQLVAAYSKKPIFYKNLRKAWYGLGTTELAKNPKLENSHLIQPLMYTLARDGHIPSEIPLVTLETTLMRIFNSAVEEWTHQNWSMERLRSELYSSFALVFRGIFDSAETEKLNKAIQALKGQ